MRASKNLSLGETLHTLRKVTRVSQTELGKALSLHQTAICRIEQGFQQLTAEQLYLASQYFDVSAASILQGDIDYWHLAEKFGRQPPFPKRYLAHAHSRVREVLPFLDFAGNRKGRAFPQALLKSLDITPVYLTHPDQRIGANLGLDVLRTLIRKGVLNKDSLGEVAERGRQDRVQGILHSLYLSQKSGLALVQAWALNSEFYDSNFDYRVEEVSRNSLELSIAPAEHMKELDYKDDVLRDMICSYKKEMLSAFPRYIGQKPLKLTEKQCHFHGAESCVYVLGASAA